MTQDSHDRLYSQALQFAKARLPASVHGYGPADWVVGAVLDALKSVAAPAKPAREYNGPVFEHTIVSRLEWNSAILLDTWTKAGWQLCAIEDYKFYFKRELT